MKNIKSFTSRSGVNIPSVGFGTFLIEPQDTAAAVANAINAGYRHIDTAEVYGNEQGVGDGIKQSGVKREELFITTKLWQGGYGGEAAKTPAQVKASFNESLAKLGLDYLDLYLVHSPYAGKERLNQWQALLELKAAGKVRALGVSNFNIKHLEEIKAAGLELPEFNQLELHPWSQKFELVDYLKAHGIQPIAYSSLAPLSTWRTGQTSAKNTEAIEMESAVNFSELAAKYGVTEAQLLLRWGVQSGYAVLPKSLNAERMAQNLAISDLFAISQADMDLLKTQNRGGGIAWETGDPLVVE
ncbi:MAG: aldo/keto reductase [Neisseria sp.]|nr:aldo/keto reductase [Neisseria sp.]